MLEPCKASIQASKAGGETLSLAGYDVVGLEQLGLSRNRKMIAEAID